MSTNVFNNAAAVFQSDYNAVGNSLSAFSTVKMGGTTVDLCLIGTSQGEQRTRLQVDATVDGSLWAIGITGGVGTYHMVFYDGVRAANCSGIGSGQGWANGSVMEKYLRLKNVDDKETTIYIYPPMTKTGSSKCCGIFKGLVDNMRIQLKDEQDGNVALYVALSVTGGWVQ